MITPSIMSLNDGKWQPYQEPFLTTLTRTGIIAMVVGAILVVRSGGIAYWPTATLLVLWPSFGGHWVEIGFVNWLRARLPAARAVQVVSRLIYWFICGLLLAYGMRLTAMALSGFRPHRWPAWWIGGAAFIGVEFIAHIALQLRGRPSFYNGRG